MHLPTHTLFFRPIMCKKKRALHLFLKITFFSSLLLLLTPETLSNHLFRQTNDQKWSKKLPKGEKTFFFFFCIVYFTFLLSPYGIKQNHLLFFPLFITGNRKTGSGNVLLKNFFFFFFFFFYFFASYRSSCLGQLPLTFFFRNFDLKCPKMPISALKFHFLQITFFSAVITQTHHLPTHTRFFRPIMCKKCALHLFLKITFFLLSTPSPYPRNTS